jgi:hypothetical protein
MHCFSAAVNIYNDQLKNVGNHWPDYQDIELASTPLKWGYYIPGLIGQYRPDIELIEIRLDFKKNTDCYGNIKYHHRNVDYSDLSGQIELALASGKKVGLLVEDEHVHYEKNHQLVEIVNRYQTNAVYWLTQYDSKRIQSIYRNQHGLECKILELPWLILNECLVYSYIKRFRVPTTILSRRHQQDSTSNFFNVSGKYEPFRKQLLETLVDHGLDQYGLLTVPKDSHDWYHSDKYQIGQQVQIELHAPYGTPPRRDHDKMAAQFFENNVWLSCNTQNFLHLERTYIKYPLAIIPETNMTNFFATEKSVWPALLGKMFLILGPAGCMSYVQRFYDVDLSQFVNLDFDQIDPVLPEHFSEKINCMLSQNRNFVVNAKQIYAQYQDQFQAAQDTIGPNIYKFVLAQLDLIQ